ncbi:MAG: divalent-cation tolerance protein CutA [Planctomycetota bacterium]|jgi:periplasmic divalent cation tolerance protein
MTDVRVLLCTAPPAEAERIARQLVERQLAACVNVLPGAMSIYRWEGEVQSEAESLLVIKATAGEVEALIEALPGLHPYEVPELLSLPVDGGLPAYLAWVRSS